MGQTTAPRRDGARRDHAAIRRLADELLPALMSRLEASALGELEVSQDGWRVRLRKPADERRDGTQKAVADAAGTAKGPADGRAKPGGRREAAVDGESPRRAVTSPAVGIFQPQDGASIGRQVRAGDIVGRVDVLGVPQEVVAPFDGVLGRMLVQPGEIVEYGEPLVRIDPARRSASGTEPSGSGPA